MFRPIRRAKKEISNDAARQLLHESKRGVLAVNGDDGYPYAIPVNYLYDEEQGKIYFHGAKAGHKVDSLKKCDKVCFTVFGNETIKDLEWAPYWQSTVVFGRCHLLETNEETEQILRRVARRYYPNEATIDEEIASSVRAVQMYEITIEHMSGKEIQER